MEENVFSKVLGYEDEKKELLLIRSWILDEKIMNNEKLTVPKGILFYGEPGCGKTLILREYSKSFNCPIYVIDGDKENLCNEIHEVFEKARKEKLAIVLIDEIDLLIGKLPNVERTLQSELDGINQNGHVLVMATTNHRRKLDDALVRTGRFDREILISYPDRKTRGLIIKSFISELKIDDTNIDYEHIGRITRCCNGADLKAIVNDVYLRCKDKVTTDDIEKSYERVARNDYRSDDCDSLATEYQIAVHEAGHALMCLKYKDDYSFYRACLTKDGGYVEKYDVDDSIQNYRKRIEDIAICVGGYIAEKIVFKQVDVGSYTDLEKAFESCERLVNHSCITNPLMFLPHYTDNKNYLASEERRTTNEKSIRSFFNKFYKKTYKYLKKNKKQLIKFADSLFDKKKISYKELSTIF